MKGNLGIVSVHHIKLNEKFLQREKKNGRRRRSRRSDSAKQGDIEKTGGKW